MPPITAIMTSSGATRYMRCDTGETATVQPMAGTWKVFDDYGPRGSEPTRRGAVLIVEAILCG